MGAPCCHDADPHTAARDLPAERTGGESLLPASGIDQSAGALQSGGNMEGKEVRFGIANSALWAVATTAASNGASTPCTIRSRPWAVLRPSG